MTKKGYVKPVHFEFPLSKDKSFVWPLNLSSIDLLSKLISKLATTKCRYMLTASSNHTCKIMPLSACSENCQRVAVGLRLFRLCTVVLHTV